MTDDAGAFCRHAHPRRTGRSGGPLEGLTFAAKDIISVKGVTPCFGNPTWLATHGPSSRDARAVSLTGENTASSLQFNPRFGSLVGRRVELARNATFDMAKATAAREAIREWLRRAFDSGACVLLPSAPGAAPEKGQPDDAVDRYTGRALLLTSLASLAGTPQISLPVCTAEDSPFGLSILGPAGSDGLLLDLAVRIADRYAG